MSGARSPVFIRAVASPNTPGITPGGGTLPSEGGWACILSVPRKAASVAKMRIILFGFIALSSVSDPGAVG